MKKSAIKLGILTGTVAAMLGLSPTFAAGPAQSSSSTSSPSAATTTPSPAQGTTPNANPSGQAWGDRIFDEFQQMQTRMEKLFNDATHDLNQSEGIFGNNGYTSSVKLSEDNADYVVRVSLPERNMNNVEARVEPGNVLRITAKEEKKEVPQGTTKDNSKSPQPSVYELGRYEQLLTLPGPVDASKLKIDRSGDWVTITLPKSMSSNTNESH